MITFFNCLFQEICKFSYNIWTNLTSISILIKTKLQNSQNLGYFTCPFKQIETSLFIDYLLIMHLHNQFGAYKHAFT